MTVLSVQRCGGLERGERFGLERQATSAIFYSGEVIHGMLQTEGYA